MTTIWLNGCACAVWTCLNSQKYDHTLANLTSRHITKNFSNIEYVPTRTKLVNFKELGRQWKRFKSWIYTLRNFTFAKQLHCPKIRELDLSAHPGSIGKWHLHQTYRWQLMKKIVLFHWLKASFKISTNLDNLHNVWKPSNHRFHKCKIWYWNCEVASCHVTQHNTNWYIQHENKVTWEKQSGSNHYLLFYHTVHFAHHTALYVINLWRSVLEKILTTSNFRSTFAAVYKVTKYIEAKKSLVIRCSVPSDHTQ